jgi:photosystem II stability/assembly factor-like uncharacterized protein
MLLTAQLLPVATFRDVTSDHTGRYLAAVADNLCIYTSQDYGSSWIEQTSSGPYDWQAIASDESGRYLAAVGIRSFIYTSIDYGISWQQQRSTQRLWWDIAASSSERD